MANDEKLLDYLKRVTADLQRTREHEKRRGGNHIVHYEEIRETVAVTTADTKAAVRRMLEQRGVLVGRDAGSDR